jgi:hypothetical protein
MTRDQLGVAGCCLAELVGTLKHCNVERLRHLDSTHDVNRCPSAQAVLQWYGKLYTQITAVAGTMARPNQQ